jgi:hypothetical protein
MSDDVTRLDGNDAAGPLARFFAIDVTRITVICDACHAESRLAELHLYGGSMGLFCDVLNAARPCFARWKGAACCVWMPAARHA